MLLNLAELFHDIPKLAALAVKYALSWRHLSQKAIAELYRSYSGIFASVVLINDNRIVYIYSVYVNICTDSHCVCNAIS
jgi:hypothetical protein